MKNIQPVEFFLGGGVQKFTLFVWKSVDFQYIYIEKERDTDWQREEREI